MILVAFYSQSYNNLFTMMLTQMAIKQVSYNILEWFTPILKVKSKLNALIEEYKSAIDKYTPKRFSD